MFSHFSRRGLLWMSSFFLSIIPRLPEQPAGFSTLAVTFTQFPRAYPPTSSASGSASWGIQAQTGGGFLGQRRFRMDAANLSAGVATVRPALSGWRLRCPSRGLPVTSALTCGKLQWLVGWGEDTALRDRTAAALPWNADQSSLLRIGPQGSCFQQRQAPCIKKIRSGWLIGNLQQALKARSRRATL